MTTPVAGTSDDSTVGDGFKRTSVPRSTSPSPSGSGTSNLGRKDSRRRPLSLKTNFKTGALVTECHHYCCQDISEHQKTRGYSFTSRTNSSSLASGSQGAAATSFTCDTSAFGVGAPSAGSAPESQQQNLKAKAGGGGGGGICQRQQPHQDNYCWPIWSPRMLHETLHQNSKSSLLYAKNNVLLETQSHGTIAGYLSLHQTSSDDLILKWIPNQLINGGERHQNGARREAKVEQTEFGTAADLSSDVSNSAEAVDQADNCSGPKQHLVSNTTRDNKSNCDNNSHDGADQNGGDNYVTTSRSTHSQAPVGGSFLDLVVSLSVSRIVLLHCHFNGQTLIGTSRGQQQVSSQDSWQPVAAQQVAATNNCASHSTNNVVEDHDGEGEREEGLQAGGAELELSAASSDATPKASILQQQAEAETEPALVESSTEETLILVEADGIQRAPFKFPKGGLRWLLSCLDSGLRPDKYLEPAIKLDTSNTDETGSYLPDPLQMTHDEAVAKTNSHPCGENIAGESWATTTTSSGSLGSNSPSAASEPMSGSGSSRLDILLRRLPSLRRPGNKSKSADGLPPAPNSSQANSRNASPTPALIEEQQQQQHEQHLPQERAPLASQANSTRPMPFNYVYRIVSINQSEWGQGPGGRTPPHSADYRAGAKLGRNKKLSQHQRQQANSSGSQMFRWSLSKLTRFSSRTGSTSTASSSIGGGGASGTGGSSAPFGSNSTAPPASETGGSLMSLFYHQISSASCSQQATIGSTGSFGCDSLDQQQHRHLSDTMNSLEDNAGGANSSIGSLRRGSSSELIRIESKLSNLKKASSEELLALRDLSIMTLCETMRKQILARAFYGWLVYCRRMKIIRNHLVKLINLDCLNLIDEHDEPDAMEEARLGLTRQRWNDIISMVEARKPTTDNTSDKLRDSKSNVRAGDLDDSQFELNLVRYVNQLVYYGGIEDNSLRKEVWPYLLGHYKLSDSPAKIVATDESCRAVYESLGRDWSKIERVVKRRDNEILAANMAKVARRQQRQSGADASIPSGCVMSDKSLNEDSEIDEGEDDDVYDEVEERHEEVEEEKENDCKQPISIVQVGRSVDDTNNCSNRQEVVDGADKEQLASVRGDDGTAVKVNEQQLGERTVTSTTERKHGEEDCKAKVSANAPGTREGSIVNRVRKTSVSKQQGASRQKKKRRRRRFRLESTGSVGSDASITDQFGNNVHRIDKDVQRCDRNFWYFKDADNLNKLRNIMCSYVWQHLDVGYVQGMCDLAAPFLVIFDEEIKAYYCFEQLMKRMVANFPHGSQMDQHFESLKYLMQVLDPKLFEVLQSNGDYTHFYFCYRWLLLDFKRELVYEDVYRVWETIWSARHVATDHFVIFLALAMVRYYRDIIIENNMDFTDTIKFFNEMAERHDIKRIIALAQDSIVELECLIRDLS